MKNNEQKIAEYVYEILREVRNRGNKLRIIDEKIDYQRLRTGARAMNYENERVDGGTFTDTFLDATHKIMELEKEREKVIELPLEFYKLLECLDILEWHVVFAFYANGKSYKDIIQKSIDSNMYPPSIDTLKSRKRRAVKKMIKHATQIHLCNLLT